MKKILISLIVLFSIVGGGFLTAKAAGQYYNGSDPDLAPASTTASMMVGGTATSTKTFSSDGFDQMSWLVAIGASTTPPTICWTNQYSNNAVDWYTEDTVYASSTIHVATEKQECMLYATTSASTFLSRGIDGATHYIGRRIVVPNLGTSFARTIFSINPGAQALVDIRGIRKNQVIVNKN